MKVGTEPAMASVMKLCGNFFIAACIDTIAQGNSRIAPAFTNGIKLVLKIWMQQNMSTGIAQQTVKWSTSKGLGHAQQWRAL